jgi:hypothetical protein
MCGLRFTTSADCLRRFVDYKFPARTRREVVREELVDVLPAWMYAAARSCDTWCCVQLVWVTCIIFVFVSTYLCTCVAIIFCICYLCATTSRILPLAACCGLDLCHTYILYVCLPARDCCGFDLWHKYILYSYLSFAFVSHVHVIGCGRRYTSGGGAAGGSDGGAGCVRGRRRVRSLCSKC